MARQSSTTSSKSYRRRAAKLSRMIAYYVRYVRPTAGRDIKGLPTARELKAGLHLMLDTVQVDSKGRAVARDDSQDGSKPTTL